MTKKFIKINHDVNGNPRYVFDYTVLSFNYEKSCLIAKKIGASKYKGKEYSSGCFVISTFNLEETKKFISMVKTEMLVEEISKDFKTKFDNLKKTFLNKIHFQDFEFKENKELVYAKMINEIIIELSKEKILKKGKDYDKLKHLLIIKKESC